MEYINSAKIYKAMGDETRLQIIDLLSCEELCACEILDYFLITQSTLSYHMKYLIDSRIVLSKKEGSWVKYSLNKDLVNELRAFTDNIFDNNVECICKQNKKSFNCKS